MTRIGKLMMQRTREEDGMAVMVAIVILGLMMGLGLAALRLTDSGAKQSRVERVRESSFNLAEGALQQQSYILGGGGWPRADVTTPPPNFCTLTTTSDFCPTVANLANAAGTGAYSEADYRSATTTWKTYIRDNVAVNSTAYTSAVDSTPCMGTNTTPCTKDANGDDLIWVRSEATVRGKRRILTALLKREVAKITLPSNVLVAGSLDVGQNGQGSVITTTGPAPILRCTAGPTCADYQAATKNKPPQVNPDSVTYDPSYPGVLPPDQIQHLLDLAASNTYTSCPTEAQLTADVVVIDLPSPTMTCKVTGNATINSSAHPGIIIMTQGILELAGGNTIYGVIYHLNRAGWTSANPDLVQITGTPNIIGGIIVEGQGGVFLSGNARLTYDPNIFPKLQTAGAAGLVQNTWRELPLS